MLLLSFSAINVSRSQYNDQRLIPGKQNTGWTMQQYSQMEYNNQLPTQNNVIQQQPQQPYNYYSFPKMGTNGVRMTNKLPGYGRSQNDYQSTDSEKGFYMLIGYTMGKDKGKGVVSEVQNSDLPGNWVGRSLGNTTAFSIGAGTFLSGTLRVEFAYSSYSGLKYYNKAIESYGDSEEENSGPIDYKTSESEGITADNMSVGMYYSMKDVIGDFLGGMFNPYVGGSMGLAYNKLGSYTLEFPGSLKNFPSGCKDGDGNLKPWENNGDAVFCGTVNDDGNARYIGAITSGFSMSLEAGITMQIQEKIAIDFFYKNNKLGSISTSGEVVTTRPLYDVHLNDDPSSNPPPAGYEFSESANEDGSVTAFYYFRNDEVALKKSRKESGSINTWEMGIKLRAYF